MRVPVTLSVALFYCLAGCVNHHSRLKDTPSGGNHLLSQEREPSFQEKTAGLSALKAWKHAGAERNEMIDDIVLGKTLIGMKAEDVFEMMGPSSDGFDIRGTGECTYAIPRGGASSCDLKLELGEDGRVKRAYLDVNY